MVRLHKIEGKTLSDIARQYNADVATTSRSLKVYGEIEVDKAYTEWTKELVLNYGKDLVQNNNGSLPDTKVVDADHRGWIAALQRHYPGGMFKLRDDLGVK